MSEPSPRLRRAVGPPPDKTRLRQAALDHLARYAATEAGVRRILERRVARWARAAEAEGQDRAMIAAVQASSAEQIAAIARSLTEVGAVNDGAFAESRVRRLARAGRSRRAIAAHLAAKGVQPDIAAAALPDGEDAELDAALAFCRRRRLGPFAREAEEGAARLKALGAFARGGFSQAIARKVLAMDPAEAEDRLLASRQG